MADGARPARHHLLRIGPDDLPDREIDVDIPARVVIGFGSVWVTDSGGALVYRLGPVQS